MAHKSPLFWWKKRGLAGFLLSPAGRLYGHFAARKMQRALPPRVDAPVLCIGNFTLGGTGKTPLAIAFAESAKKHGLKPGIISRGFGGSAARNRKKEAVHVVNAERDSARIAGDEPLLLADYAPVAIGADRLASAQALLGQGVNFIIMDDGFQSRRLYPDYALLAVDAMLGLGNGKIFPAGPLRAPLPVQLAYSDSLVLIGEAAEGSDIDKEIVRLATRAGHPVARAALQMFIMRGFAGGKREKEKNYALPITHIRDIKGRKFLAFTGIGNPQKFFAGLKKSGAVLEREVRFADHYFFTGRDIEALAQSASRQKLLVATTAKDYMRLKSDGLDKKLPHLLVLDIRLRFAGQNFCDHILSLCQSRYAGRHK